jgi:hypothetical protein
VSNDRQARPGPLSDNAVFLPLSENVCRTRYLWVDSAWCRTKKRRSSKSAVDFRMTGENLTEYSPVLRRV